MRAKKKNCDKPTMNHSSIKSWGPSAWTFLHVISFSYPDNPTKEDKINMFNYLYYFARVLPCPTCKKDFLKYLQQKLPANYNSEEFENKRNFSMFIVDAHNYINKKLDKKIVNYDVVETWYTKHNNKCLTLKYILIFFIILCSLLVVRKTKLFSK